MPFWSKKNKNKPAESQVQASQSRVVIMQSNVLGMTVIQQDCAHSQNIQQLSVDQWIDILGTQKLDGFPYQRILFSFLKGIPDFMRLKIWLLLCSQNNAQKFRYTSKTDHAQLKSDSLMRRRSSIKVQEVTVQVYRTLCEKQPLEKQVEQIEKDVKRSFSQQKTKYKYLQPLLRKMLWASSTSGIQYMQGMNYILLNILIFALQSIGVNSNNVQALEINYQRDIFVVYREAIIRMDEVYGNNNIFTVIKQLQQNIAAQLPQILFAIYNAGLDCFSAFGQNYFSVMSYSDPPQDLSKLMLDLFFLTGEKAIHATILRMLSMTKDHILELKNPQQIQKFLKNDIYFAYYKQFVQQRMTAKSIQDFGLCFFDSVQRMDM